MGADEQRCRCWRKRPQLRATKGTYVLVVLIECRRCSRQIKPRDGTSEVSATAAIEAVEPTEREYVSSVRATHHVRTVDCYEHREHHHGDPRGAAEASCERR